MEVKQLYIAGFSPNRTTWQTLLNMARGLPDMPCIELDFTLPGQRGGRHYELNSDDLLLIGFPVYGGRLPGPSRQIFDELRGKQTPAIVCVVYGGRDYDDALLELKLEVEQKGFKVIGAASCLAQHCLAPQVGQGRPDRDDAQQQAAFLAMAYARLQAGQASASLLVPGEFPYRKPVPSACFAPATSSQCNLCGHCAAVCPMGAISPDKPNRTDARLCMTCGACLNICPQAARTLEQLRGLAKMLQDNFSYIRKRNLFYI